VGKHRYLVRDEENKLVIPIENKVGTSEHPGQLERYWTIISAQYPSWKRIGLYLTPDGDPPSHSNFLAIDYGLIAALLEDLVESRTSSLSPDAAVVITHYVQMLRRHIVSESDIAELCRQIYRKHRKALDLIFEHRPDQQASIQDFLEELIKETDNLELDSSKKRFVRFGCKDWDLPTLKSGSGWTPSGRILLFEFQNEPESLKLKLIIGPGPRGVREKLFNMACDHRPPCKPASKTLMNQWNEVFSRPFLSQKSYGDSTDEQLRTEIREQWKQFLTHDLPEMRKAIKPEA
jgi:hypothetical protein